MRNRFDPLESHRSAVHDAEQLECQRRITLDRILDLVGRCVLVLHEVEQLQRTRLTGRQVALHDCFGLTIEIPLKQRKTSRRAFGSHRVRLHTLSQHLHVERTELSHRHLQLIGGLAQHIHLHHRRQFEQWHPLLVPDEIIERDRIATLPGIGNGGDHLGIRSHAFENLEDDSLRVEQLPRPLHDQIA